ncbi:MAG TPA: ATP-binding cassette domain-containing protein [Thermoflexales bacterium]|nr:ATP-binding cassette domain-containing protein [Thermoflexales bacterium]HQZ22982.1 ATP-binding cassette domain-containing protein [Thermoflexales bacterium]
MPENVISVSHIAKSFGSAQAVRDVSFDVNKGEVFGLLGPNGAGKTTTIRMILDIFRPDTGNIAVLGGPMDDARKNRIGYMPEERGLYKDMRIEECVVYLAQLKGVPKDEARRRASQYFDRLDLAAHKKKKINDLSRGMQQKVQIIATLIHQPDLIIIDEPFANLDPVNTRIVQDLLLGERERGATIVMSTHLMFQVEELCDRIVIINKGQNVLYGKVDEIRRTYSDNAIRVTAQGEMPQIDGMMELSRKGNTRTLSLPPALPPREFMRILAETPNLNVEQFELALPTMDDVFVKVVQGVQS